MGNPIYVDTEDEGVEILTLVDPVPSDELKTFAANHENRCAVEYLRTVADYWIGRGMTAGHEGFEYHVNLGPIKASWAGVCYTRASSEDGLTQMFLQATISETRDVWSTTGHEVGHGFDDCQSKHGKAFRLICESMGLETLDGKVTRMHARAGVLDAEFEAFVTEHGEFPYAKLTAAGKKQTVRNLKIMCAADDCEFFCRTARSKIDEWGMPAHCGRLCEWDIAQEEDD